MEQWERGCGQGRDGKDTCERVKVRLLIKGRALHVNGTGGGLSFNRHRTVFFEVHDSFA